MHVVRFLVLITLGVAACDSRQDPAETVFTPDLPIGDEGAVDDGHPTDTPAPDNADTLTDDTPSPDPMGETIADPGIADPAGDDIDTWAPDDPGVFPTDATDLVNMDTENDLPVYHPCPIRPVLFVHGINGSSAGFQTMAGRLEADGWTPEHLYFFDAEDPSWGCNVDNAAVIQTLVDSIMDETGSDRVDIVAHSMGTISSRYFIKNLGGTEKVNTYVTLGGMHHGLLTPCLAPEFVRMFVCVWLELCQSGEFIGQLNADPATPGLLHWVSLYGTADETVPNDSSHLDSAENIVFEGVAHDGDNGLLEVEEVYEEVRRVLQYPCW